MKVNKFQRGQIWWYENSSTYDGNVQGKTRPVILISNNKANENSNSLIAIPCTTKIKRMDLKTHIRFNIDENDNIALCESLFNANTTRLTNYIGTCDKDLIDKLEQGVRIALALDNELDSDISDNCICNEHKEPESVEILKCPDNLIVTEDNSVDKKRVRRPNMTTEEKHRFLNDCENHNADYMIKKYHLIDKADLAKKKYAFRKQLESKGEI